MKRKINSLKYLAISLFCTFFVINAYAEDMESKQAPAQIENPESGGNTPLNDIPTDGEDTNQNMEGLPENSVPPTDGEATEQAPEEGADAVIDEQGNIHDENIPENDVVPLEPTPSLEPNNNADKNTAGSTDTKSPQTTTKEAVKKPSTSATPKNMPETTKDNPNPSAPASEEDLSSTPAKLGTPDPQVEAERNALSDKENEPGGITEGYKNPYISPHTKPKKGSDEDMS